jgi:hypothetical protein
MARAELSFAADANLREVWPERLLTSAQAACNGCMHALALGEPLYRVCFDTSRRLSCILSAPQAVELPEAADTPWVLALAFREWATAPAQHVRVNHASAPASLLRRFPALKREPKPVQAAVQHVHSAWLATLGALADECVVDCEGDPGVVLLHVLTWTSLSYLFLTESVLQDAAVRDLLVGVDCVPGRATFRFARVAGAQPFAVAELDHSTADPNCRTPFGQAPRKRPRRMPTPPPAERATPERHSTEGAREMASTTSTTSTARARAATAPPAPVFPVIVKRTI